MNHSIGQDGFSVRIRSRRTLVVLAVLVQAGLLGVGWFIGAGQIQSDMAKAEKDVIFNHLVHSTERILMEFARRGEAGFIQADWIDAFRSVAAEFELPNGGHISIISPDGELRQYPKQSDVSHSTIAHDLELQIANTDTWVAISSLPGNRIVAGMFHHSKTQIDYVATRVIPGTQSRVIVHQPEDGFVAISDTFVDGVFGSAGLIGVLILALTGLCVLSMSHRYDTALAEVNRGLEAQVKSRVAQFVTARHALIFGLAKLADYRDTDTGAHLDRICTYSTMLAEELRDQCTEIDDDWMGCLKLAASLHDIGKVGIPDRVLLKPGRLNDEERMLMERHSLIGADTLLAIRKRLGDDDLINMSIQIALGHHERWDGTGYPFGLEGTETSLAARIVALADVYDALTSKRVYKEAMSHEKAFGIIVDGRGTQFEPAVVDVFIDIHEQFNEARHRLQVAGISGVGAGLGLDPAAFTGGRGPVGDSGDSVAA